MPLNLQTARLPQRLAFVIHGLIWVPASLFGRLLLQRPLVAGTEFQLGAHHFHENYDALHGKVYSTQGPMGTLWWVPMAW